MAIFRVLAVFLDYHIRFFLFLFVFALLLGMLAYLMSIDVSMFWFVLYVIFLFFMFVLFSIWLFTGKIVKDFYKKDLKEGGIVMRSVRGFFRLILATLLDSFVSLIILGFTFVVVSLSLEGYEKGTLFGRDFYSYFLTFLFMIFAWIRMLQVWVDLFKWWRDFLIGSEQSGEESYSYNDEHGAVENNDFGKLETSKKSISNKNFEDKF